MIQIIGLERVQRLLNNLPKEIEKQIGDKGTHELAINLQNRMKRRVPVGNTCRIFRTTPIKSWFSRTKS